MSNQKMSIYLATPVHSEVSIHYAQSVLDFQKECLDRNIDITVHMMKSSLVTQGPVSYTHLRAHET